MKTSYKPLSKDNWEDFENLFGKNGACGGCWCMWWKLPRKDFALSKGDKNREHMKNSVENCSPGILLYEDNVPAGWCAVERRENYPQIEKSRNLKRIDDKPVWSVTCFYIAKDFRRKGYSVQLLKYAKKYCAQQGGKILEGYPNDIGKETPPPFIFTGTLKAFLQAGFIEVARPSRTKVIVRSKV
jgi:GNAT superfamily N-acetyltransferase